MMLGSPSLYPLRVQKSVDSSSAWDVNYLDGGWFAARSEIINGTPSRWQIYRENTYAKIPMEVYSVTMGCLT